MKKLLLLFFIMTQLTFSYINIYPLSFDKRIDGDGGYQEFTLFNQSAETVIYRIYVEPDTKNPKMSMDRWMNFYPRSLTLHPGEEGIIKLSIASYGEIPQGEYSAILGIRELPVFDQEVAQDKSAISIFTDFRMILNGYAGDIKPFLKLYNIALEDRGNKIVLQGIAENSGERQGKYELYADDYFLGNLRIKKDNKLNLRDYDFSYTKNKDYKKPKKLIVKDFDTKEEVFSINLE